MNTNQINEYLKNFHCFLGTFPEDKIFMKIEKKPAAMVVNTDPSSKPGTHWVAIFLNDDGTGEYFDPFGFPPLTERVINFINTNSPNGWDFNKITFQTPVLSKTCGIYCILFIKDRCRNISFRKFVSKFSRNVFLNDILAQIYIGRC